MIFEKINEAMSTMHDEKLLLNILEMIIKPIKEKDGHHVVNNELNRDEFVSLKERYKDKKRQLFETKDKKRYSG